MHETAALEQCQADLSGATFALAQCLQECDTRVAAFFESAVQSRKVTNT